MTTKHLHVHGHRSGSGHLHGRRGYPTCGANGTLVGTPTTTATGGSFDCSFPDGPNTSDRRDQGDRLRRRERHGLRGGAGRDGRQRRPDGDARPATRSSNEGATHTFSLGSFTRSGRGQPVDGDGQLGRRLDADDLRRRRRRHARRAIAHLRGRPEQLHGHGHGHRQGRRQRQRRRSGARQQRRADGRVHAAPAIVERGLDQQPTRYSITDPGSDTVLELRRRTGATATPTPTRLERRVKSCTFADGPDSSTVTVDRRRLGRHRRRHRERAARCTVANVAPTVTLQRRERPLGRTRATTHTYTLLDQRSGSGHGLSRSRRAVARTARKSNATNTNTSGSFDCTLPGRPGELDASRRRRPTPTATRATPRRRR